MPKRASVICNLRGFAAYKELPARQRVPEGRCPPRKASSRSGARAAGARGRSRPRRTRGSRPRPRSPPSRACGRAGSRRGRRSTPARARSDSRYMEPVTTHGAVAARRARAPAPAPPAARARPPRRGPPSWRDRLSSVAGGSAPAREDRVNTTWPNSGSSVASIVDASLSSSTDITPTVRRPSTTSPSGTRERSCTGGVVRAVHDRERLRGPRPRAGRECGSTGPPRAPRSGSSATVESLRGGHRDGEVVALEGAARVQLDPADRPKSRPISSELRVPLRDDLSLRRPRSASGPSAAGDEGAAGGHDRELLLRDVRLGRPEPARVLEAHVGQHLHGGADHAGRVVAPAEARPPRRRPRLRRRQAPSTRPRSAPRTASRGRRGRACARRGSRPRPRARSAAAKDSSSTGRPPVSTRSAKLTRCGDR